MNVHRRQREIERTREDILEAAARAFGQTGYAKATMQDIAREAGYTAASLYTYFRSKEEIVEGLLELLNAEYLRSLQEPVPSGLSFRQRCEIVTTRQLEIAERRSAVFSSLFMGAGDCADHKGVARLLHAGLQKRMEGITDWLRQNAEPADLGGYDLDFVARFLFGTMSSIVHGWLMDSPRERLIDRGPTLVNLFLYGISGPPASSRKQTP